MKNIFKKITLQKFNFALLLGIDFLYSGQQTEKTIVTLIVEEMFQNLILSLASYFF